ncbi:MAG: autotransporter-associated beta strand repeat-containing protein [Kiritimatiellae bacterium]|nr:autotransporter-associated beta strand repeat-containing protein [Kiritimatiellia bacterium]
MRGAGKFGICAEEALGASPAAFTYNKLDFGGSTLIITNSLALDDPNRGLHLNTLTTGLNAPGGVFEVNNPATATVACVISGAGPLTKRGSGTLVLATNNTYTGITKVEAGTLRLDPDGSMASPTLIIAGAAAAVAGEGALGDVILVNGGCLLVEKGGWDLGALSVSNTTEVTFAVDLADADPGTTLIRLSGTLSKQPLQVFQFVINTNNTSTVPYKLLSASNLSEFPDYDFCVNPPWIGQLSRADDGMGGEVLLFTPTPPEKIITKVEIDANNISGFTLGAKWSDGMVPTVDKTYLYNNANTLRTPQVGSLTFGGGRLIVDKSSTVALKGLGTPTITNLVVMNDTYLGMWENSGSRLAGNILMYPLRDAGKFYALRVTSSNMGRSLDLYSTLLGYGDLFLQAQGDPNFAGTIYSLLGNNSDYFGKIRVDGNSNCVLRITSEAGIGGALPIFRSGHLTFNGGGLSVTNDVVLSDLNRGITLLATGGTSSTGSNPGAFPSGTPAELRRYAGGCSFRPESEGVRLTVNCPITGPGALIKDGMGTLVLGGDNSYTGLTQIIAGKLKPISANALGTGPVLLKPEGRLLRSYPEPMLANGVELGGPITFESGSAIRVELEAGATATGNFSLNLFLLAEGDSIAPEDVPIEHDLNNYRAVVSTSMVGPRALVSVTLVYQGTTLIVR